jgi:mono/diheme cytochrome c family protein
MLLVFIFSFTIISCSSDDDSPIIDPPAAEKVTYIKNVKSIIDGNCLGCHGETLAN